MVRNAQRFHGWIAGVGTSSGTRIVLGHWPRSPFGPFGDVMLERADGQRLLLAPSRRVADFVAAVYRFDRVLVVPVTVEAAGRHWHVTAGPLRMRFTTGRRGALGLLLRCVPAPLAARPAWVALTDVPARLMPGVRTRGSAGGGYREWYGVRDLRGITTVEASWEGRDLGPLAPVDPPVRFGFGSSPRTPALVRVVTTVAGPPGSPLPASGPASGRGDL
ncbi:hypothetical protein ACG5V6_09365 [Streptomyces chitinivorans]|uniref:Phosphodiesterase n=1 Tax=Streptomyces chitinivorans TaxID=1257027 RepID=A0ABW7HRB6_9ACTN|nr:hypothetical protein [Streptomyces chitinivorans]MDH2408558.1 hypothetical protein [Streptomyces chitinivorans]